ncbi:hypothetical protein K0M31_004297 [Melipona bicolor]|uniref:Uncharacterized protein n=1 Tax=Melipona bicolor TaxID=60889 RepID=A0AA40FXG5_9HYME|nr:hypothetical protein K0M31_004297 [Melipona bicolor]
MTNYGSFHGCNVPAHASEELDVSGLESEDGFLQHGSTTMPGGPQRHVKEGGKSDEKKKKKEEEEEEEEEKEEEDESREHESSIIRRTGPRVYRE